MKEITAVIRPGKLPETLAGLKAIGIAGFTRQRVYGRGKQKGLQYSAGGGGDWGISFLPKWMLMVVIEDSKADSVIKALLGTNQTGNIGDGKIFICSISESVRIRTGESEKDFLN